MATAIRTRELAAHRAMTDTHRQTFVASSAITTAKAEARALLSSKSFETMSQDEKNALLKRALIVLGLIP